MLVALSLIKLRTLRDLSPFVLLFLATGRLEDIMDIPFILTISPRAGRVLRDWPTSHSEPIEGHSDELFAILELFEVDVCPFLLS